MKMKDLKEMEEAKEMERRAADEYNRASQMEKDAAAMVRETIQPSEHAFAISPSFANQHLAYVVVPDLVAFTLEVGANYGLQRPFEEDAP